MKIPLRPWTRTRVLSAGRQAPFVTSTPADVALPPARAVRLEESVSVDFLHNRTVVHSICRIEKQQSSRLSLRVVVELGKISLVGLKKGTLGYLEIDNRLLPFAVEAVDLPCVTVVAFPQLARPVRRQQLRVPASFFVRFRRQESTGMWLCGQGIDISAGGCQLALSPPTVPRIGESYDVDMLITLPDGSEERPLLSSKIRWVRATSRNIYVGTEAHPTQRLVLASAMAQFQRSLSRRHGDYLLGVA